MTAAGISNSLPLRYTTLLDIFVHAPGSAGERKVAARSVSGAYFDAIGLRFVEGTAFDERRKDQVVVNEAFLRAANAGHDARIEFRRRRLARDSELKSVMREALGPKGEHGQTTAAAG